MDVTGLRRIPLFQILPEQDMEELLSISTLCDVPPGTVIFREGETSDRLLVILQGQIEVVKSLDTDVERHINTLNGGDFLGEMSIVSHEHRRTASAITHAGAQVLEVPIAELDRIIQANAGLSYELMKVMVSRLRQTESLAIRDLQEKNTQLAQSLVELKNAQAQILAQERLQYELSMARRIQESMLPEKIPALPGWNLSAYWQPARSVSGDLYDFVPLNDGRLALVVGDVSDKGVPAAMIMTITRSMLRAGAVSAETPAALLARVNDLLCEEIPMGMFVTCHVSYFDPNSGEIVYASAGHCRPLLRRCGKVVELPARGLAMGIFPEFRYENFQARLEPGDGLLLYSDGLYEAHDPGGGMLGLEVVQDIFAGSEQPIPSLLRALSGFTGAGQNPEDDVTLLYLERAG